MRKLFAFLFVCLAFYSNAQMICAGSSATIVATSTLSSPSFTLNPGNFSPITNTNTNVQYFVVSPNVTTNYTLVSSGTSTGTTVVTNSVVIQVTVNPQPIVAPTVTQASCTNSLNTININLSFNPASPAPAYTVAWQPIPPNLLSPTQTTVSGLTPGPGTVAVLAAGGCTTMATFTILPQPAPAVFSVIPFGTTHSITCVTNTLLMYGTNAALNYTWSGSSFTPVENDSIYLDNTMLGTLTILGQNPVSGCTKTYTFSIVQNTAVPSSMMSASLFNITCTQTLAPTLTVTGSPSVNVTHLITAPNNITYSATSYTTIYTPGAPGTYTYVLRNDANGCTTTKNFTVSSNDNYPTFNVNSPNSFTLGCFAKATGSINIINAQTTPIPGGSVSYTLIGPPTSTTIPTGTVPLSTISTYSMNVPGTWTVIVKDNSNYCETRQQISILQNTTVPKYSAIVPTQILSCYTPSIVLEGVSDTTGVSYNWSFIPNGGGPNNVNSYSIVAQTLLPVTATLANMYTLTVTNDNNTCKSSSVVPIYQNLFPPTTSISALASVSITCLTPTIVLTNQSKTSIPATTGFPTNSFVTAQEWRGPSPQQPLQLSTTYTAGTVGVYTLTGRDLNNGCISTGTFTVLDGKAFPIIAVNSPTVIDCGVQSINLTPTVTNGSSFSYVWTAPTATSIVGSNSVASFPVRFPGIYTVAVTNTLNGCRETATISAVNGSLTADFSADVQTGYAPLTINFTNNSTSSTGASSITSSWNYGNATTSGSTAANGTFVPGPISSTISPSVVYTQPGTYTVTMYSTKGACLDTASKVIRVDIPSELTIPNIFSPNGDGVNDLFFVKGTNLSEIHMTIFDRWGHVVYDLISRTGNVEWDGKNQQGSESATGVYFYTVKSSGKDAVAYDKKGTITLVR
ncbi:hypothetical protein CNR22_07310 [Sphingobacteriaceae bacterium]|nr:hypothetical protein CNR22_07310 [Sphingobacteriaceae bacterium]